MDWPPPGPLAMVHERARLARDTWGAPGQPAKRGGAVQVTGRPPLPP